MSGSGSLDSAKIPTAVVVGGTYNVVSPAPADGQSLALQQDANGNLLVNVAVGGGGGSSTVKIEDTSGNALNSNGTGALNVAVVSGGGSNASVGTTGAAAPTSATEIGIIDGSGNLTGVSSTTPVPVSATSAANASGNPIFTESVTGSTTAVTQATGTNLHTVVDSGTITAVTSVTNPVTVQQGTGTNLHTVVDSGSITATQATGTNLHTVVDSGSITATQATAANLKSQSIILDAAGTNLGTVKAGSTAAVDADTSLVVQLNPKQPNLDTPLNVASTLAVGTAVELLDSGGTNKASISAGGALSVAATQTTSPWVVGGAAATGAAVVGNPVLVAGSDGTNARTIITDTAGGVAPASVSAGIADGNSNTPVGPASSSIGTLWFRQLPFVFNGSTWDRARSGGTTGSTMVAGTAATGGAVSGNPVLMAGSTITTALVQPITVDTSGGVSIATVAGSLADGNSNAPNTLANGGGNAIWVRNLGFGFNSSTWDRIRTASIGNAVAATGILASTGYGEYLSTAPAPTTGQYSALQTDYAGSLFVKPIRRSTTKAQATTIASSAASTTILAAQASGIFADISNLIITVTPAATTDLAFTATLSDGTNSFIYDMDTGALATATADPTIININFNPPLPATTAATPWTLQLSVATVTVHVTVVAVLQKAS